MTPLDGWSLTIEDGLWRRLSGHLFPGDNDEHGAVVLAGLADGRYGPRLLARDVLLAIDGRDYLPGKKGYRALDPMFIAGAARRARDEGWAYLAVHCHGGSDRVQFSAIDLSSHERGYPALLQITGHPVGGLVVAPNAVAGDLWFPDGTRKALTTATVIGRNIRTFTPGPDHENPNAGLAEMFDRQARLFGRDGQRRLAKMRVGVVGLGGAGSMAVEMLARLGVGELVLIDPDRIELSNLSRIAGSRYSDAIPRRRGVRSLLGRKLDATLPLLKVEIAERLVRSIGLGTRAVGLATNVVEPAAAAALTRCDWIVLAADSQQARHLTNVIAHAYYIPVVQVGVKIPVDANTGDVGEIFTAARRILPTSGCFWCNGLIDPTSLQLEALGAEGERARAYVGSDAPAPSVVTLNGIAVSMALTEMLLSVTGLLEDPPNVETTTTYARFLPRVGRLHQDEPRRDEDCLYCGNTIESLRGRGDSAPLPTPLQPDAVPESSLSAFERFRGRHDS